MHDVWEEGLLQCYIVMTKVIQGNVQLLAMACQERGIGIVLCLEGSLGCSLSLSLYHSPLLAIKTVYSVWRKPTPIRFPCYFPAILGRKEHGGCHTQRCGVQKRKARNGSMEMVRRVGQTGRGSLPKDDRGQTKQSKYNCICTTAK